MKLDAKTELLTYFLAAPRMHSGVSDVTHQIRRCLLQLASHMSLYNCEAVRAVNYLKPNQSADQSGWPEVLATVTECKYDIGAGRALAFGIPTRNHFRIHYNYFANGEFHSGEFRSTKPIPQGHLFPIRYDPEAPHDHKNALSITSNNRTLTLVIGVFGLFMFLFLWLVILRGCH